MTVQQTRLQQYVDVIQRANQIATSTELDALLERMLGLIIEVSAAQAGTLYLYDTATDELVFKVVQGDSGSERLVGTRIAASRGLAGYALGSGRPVFTNDVMNDPRWDRQTGSVGELRLRTAYCLPLMLRGQPVGLVQIFNLPPELVDDHDVHSLLDLLSNRLVTEVEKAQMLDAARRREHRQQALVEIIARLTTTLDRDDLLDRIMDYARELLEVEATSIWLCDEKTGDLVLHLATGHRRDAMKAKRLPFGHGIIGSVVRDRKTVVVNDVQHDQRFYRQIDQQSGFNTRAILCVPLRAPRIQLGGDRGEVGEVVIGGAQALNPLTGRAFNEEDISLFETLASQAATVVRLSQLYEETNSMFSRIIDAITGAIDLKDPYTRGHSQRVSDFSVAIAQELGLPPEEIYRVRISSKLHDVGKIRIPDRVLKKRSKLNDSEFRKMRQHPTYGFEFLRDNGLLEVALLGESWQALSQHHERLDGKGYPAGLKGDEISLIGKIVAVADVFDAITSDRPYRPAMTLEQAFAILRKGAGTELDPDCVDALIAAREKGLILVQSEREHEKHGM
jgi:HD-GYP domain-containing protein (c-di-GMP phosphodiesterase class II)